MPIDLEMLLSATSHPLFYSPFSDERFSLTNTYGDHDYSRSLSLSRNHFILRPHHKQQGFVQKKELFNHYASSLNYTSKKESVSSAELPGGVRKKKVSFADDRGLNLVEVREIPEAPKWADDVMLNLLIGSTKQSGGNEKKWKTSFEHPPWHDEKLAKFLEKNMVALESVTVKEDEEPILHGTVKVKNLAYEKNIFLRVTYDRWASYVDVQAVYLKPRRSFVEKTNIYDTFSFNAKISPSAYRYDVIEFCVCYQCSGKEYWDNNGGINYRLIAEYSKCNTSSEFRSHDVRSSGKEMTLSFEDHMENFREIDSWSSFMYGQPYW